MKWHYLLVAVMLSLCFWLVSADASEPLVAWDCSAPAGSRPGDAIAIDRETFQGLGSDPLFNTLRFLPSAINDGLAARCRVAWADGQNGPGAVRLCSPSAAAEAGATLQCGAPDSSRPPTSKLSLFLRFKLTQPLSQGGGSPAFELEGTLVHLPPQVTLLLSGRGVNGRGKRLPMLRVADALPDGTAVNSTYFPTMDGEINLGQWYTLVVTWDGEQPADNNGQTGAVTATRRARMWINGVECPMQRVGHPNASPGSYTLKGPVLVGGDRSWNNAPLILDEFAIYDQLLTAPEVAQLVAHGLTGRPSPPVAPLPGYETIAALNQPQGWQEPEPGMTLGTGGNDTLTLTVNDLAVGEQRLARLKQPVPLDRQVHSVNFWACLPASLEEVGLSLSPVFADSRGQLLPGDGVDFLSSHVAAPNSRKSGLWRYVFCDPPRDKGAESLIGFAVSLTYLGGGGKLTTPHTVYLKDIGVERLDYAQTKLYYVVGNYRDNFMNTGFNGSGARALTDQSAGVAVPYVLLDNLVDQAKEGRPETLNLRVLAFDEGDRLVYSTALKDILARTVPDFLRRLPIPLTAPGTYRLQGMSSDARTGEYFTTDWVKLIVLKGPPTAAPASAPSPGLLAINPRQPFGRLEATDPRQISFVVGGDKALFPLELRYQVIPYDEFIPAWKPARALALDQKLVVMQPGTVTLPYTPRRTVELVVAELWQGNKRLDHEERPIGIRNELAKAPPLTQAAAIPTLDDLAGPGKNWLNAQLHANPGEDQAANLARNIGEVKKLTPNIGIYLSVNRVEPIPGVYDWDYLTPILDLAQSQGCRIIPYLNLKWPADWAPIEFAVDSAGCAHRGGLMWGYMIGKYLYCSGRYAPEIIRGFNQQLARRYLNHPGLGGYYFENEHMDSNNGPLTSYHEAYRADFATFLAARYGSLDKLSAAYCRPYTSWAQVRLPDADRPETVPAPVVLADFRLYQLQSAEQFLLRDEFDAVRHEDSRRPIIVYNIGNESDAFLRHVADNGGMMANGGIHSNFNMDFEYERANAVPGLRYRMEPHDMYDYDPIPHGFDEMLFGMLAMGGRGLQMHEFLPGWSTWNYAQALAPGQKTGLDKLVAARPMLAELRDAEKLHDPIGIMTLRSPQHFLGGPFEWTTWPLHCALYALSHYSPRSCPPEGRLAYLDGSKLIFIGGSVISADETAYLKRFLAAGGKVVLEASAGQTSLEHPDSATTHCLLSALGLDFFAAGEQLPGVTVPHDLYRVGPGQVLVIRRNLWNDHWYTILPAILQWAGIAERLADSADKYMQMHVLQKGQTYYLVTTHRGQQQSGYSGPPQWSGKIRFCMPLLPGQYRVTELMRAANLGSFTPEQLAAGFDAGAYEDLQMKIFRVQREP